MLELLATKFKDTTALISPEKGLVVQGSLLALAKAEKFPEMTEMAEAHASNMASTDFWDMSEQPWMAKYRPYIVRDGMLIIPVKGVLLHDFPWQVGGWATGYEYIWQAYKRGMDDSAVKGIAIVGHSPGGEVAGCFEAVDRMYAKKGTKPVRGFAHEYMYSAGYAVISVCDTITVSKTGGVGSIGVVTSHVNMEKMLKDWGLEITFIHYGKHKVDGNPYQALSKDAKDRIQARINDLGEQFVALVARNRGMDAQAVRDTEALTFTASEAVENKLADYVGPLDDALAAYAADLSTSEGEDEMADKTETSAADKAAVDNARNEGHASGVTQGQSEGAKAERARISGILACDNAKERPAAAQALAMDSDMSVEQANTFLGKLPVEKTEAKADEKKDKAQEEDNQKTTAKNKQNFDAAMESDKPDVGADASSDKPDASADADSADSVLDIAASVGIPGLRQRQKSA